MTTLFCAVPSLALLVLAALGVFVVWLLWVGLVLAWWWAVSRVNRRGPRLRRWLRFHEVLK